MNFNFNFYLSLLLRRMPVMIALFLACVTIAGIYASRLPPTYSASARLLVETPQIPESMVSSTIRTGANEQLQIIEQRLLTRANLIDIANGFNVYEDIRKMPPDQVVSDMRDRISIRRMGGRDQATLVVLEFRARNGQIAANVVNQFVSFVLEENNRFRMTRTEGTLGFFEQEVDRLGAELSLQSAEIVAFKQSNADALPENLSYRQGRQVLLQERLSRLERDLASTLDQRSEITALFEATGNLPQDLENKQQSRSERLLQELEFELEQTLGIYSENNPRVTLLRNRIAQLEKTMAEDSGIEQSQQEQAAPTILNITLAEFAERIEGYNAEIDSVQVELSALEESLSATSANAISLSALERDYDNIQNQYNNAVNNLNQARMSERIEVSSQGQRISILESANVPNEPSGPNRTKIMVFGAMTGGALAAIFFMLLELLNRKIRRPADFQSKFGITALAVIPYMESRREKFRRRALLLSALLIVIIGVPPVLYYIDTNYMPLDLLASKVLNRLGLT